jgi:hypothetical protein
MKQDSSTDFCTAISPRVSSDNQYVNSFVADLRERRYADITIRKYLEAQPATFISRATPNN